MGEAGHDIQLSNAGKKRFPAAIECKSKKQITAYRYYEQALDNSAKDGWDGFLEPVVVIKENKKAPLMIVDAMFGLYLLNLLYQLQAHGYIETTNLERKS